MTSVKANGFRKTRMAPHLQQALLRVGGRLPGHEATADGRTEFVEGGQGVRPVHLRHQHVEQDHSNLFPMPPVQLDGCWP
jgi:hypothetical protein